MFTISTKKRANSKRHDVVKANFETMHQVASYIRRNNLLVVHEPYIFTYLGLNDGSIITQDYNGIICSPSSLREELRRQGLTII